MNQLKKEDIKRFIKDYSLPIQNYYPEYIEYYINKLSEYKPQVKELWNNFKILLNKEPNFQDKKYNYLQKIVKYIQEKEEYKKLQNNKLEEFNINLNIPSKNLYNMENIDKNFISIDIKEANFYALYFYNPLLVNNNKSYDNFILNFIEKESKEFKKYFLSSKFIRQYIFGNLLPKKQRKIQKYIINEIIKVLNIDLEDIYTINNDEIILYSNEKTLPLLEKKHLLDNIKIEHFQLKNIEKEKWFYKINLDNYKISFKAIPSMFYFQALAKFENRKPNEEDLLFIYEHKLSKFIEYL